MKYAIDNNKWWKENFQESKDQTSFLYQFWRLIYFFFGNFIEHFIKLLLRLVNRLCLSFSMLLFFRVFNNGSSIILDKNLGLIVFSILWSVIWKFSLDFIVEFLIYFVRLISGYRFHISFLVFLLVPTWWGQRNFRVHRFLTILFLDFRLIVEHRFTVTRGRIGGFKSVFPVTRISRIFSSIKRFRKTFIHKNSWIPIILSDTIVFLNVFQEFLILLLMQFQPISIFHLNASQLS